MRCALKALRPSAPTGSSFRRRRVGRRLALLLLIAGAPAQAADSTSPGAPVPGDQEPITPVPMPPAADPSRLALGERLFADPRLSADGSRACISCHDIRTNGASANRLDKAIEGTQLPLNTTTVFNASLSFRLNWEGSFRTLEAQAESALENQRAMGRSIDEVVGKLRADPNMQHQFREAYGHAQ